MKSINLTKMARMSLDYAVKVIRGRGGGGKLQKMEVRGFLLQFTGESEASTVAR